MGCLCCLFRFCSNHFIGSFLAQLHAVSKRISRSLYFKKPVEKIFRQDLRVPPHMKGIVMKE